ncbi:quinone oxidoreductase family protein [Bosea sp. (in: a-proteobacteria)]|uniref:quinone oxidoreductase family protein n=1 Tax=Bosea sp. (in: a-proteobacteria) TaxID=1871050 RepID=UPI002FC803F4
MKAIQFDRFGGPEVLELVEIERPSPGPGEVLIRVGAAGVNFFEVLMRQDRYAVTPALPFRPGVEVAGTVEALGDGVDEFRIDQRVAAALFIGSTSGGGYAEYVVASQEIVAPLPDAVSFAEATALLVQGLTALHLLRQNPPAGKTVLVNAAAGGVGSLLMQLARRSGAARVIAAASSAEKLELARRLGADAGVDYTQADWPERVRAANGAAGPDLVFEASGGEITAASLVLLAPFGRLVLYGPLAIQDFRPGAAEVQALIFGNLSLRGFALLPLLRADRIKAELGELFELAARGALRPLVGGSYPLQRANEAHAALESRRSTGKVVLAP